MAYEWIARLSNHAKVWVVTTGSRLNETCGLEDLPNVQLIKIKQKVSFKWADAFDRAVHPGYIEYYWRAQRVIKKLQIEQKFDLGHHLSPRSTRYPSPITNSGLPYIVGPFHGGLKPPDILKELKEREQLFFNLRKLDQWRIRYDPVLKHHYQQASKLVISAPYVKTLLPVNLHSKVVIIPPPPSSKVANEFSDTERQSDNNGQLKMMYVGRITPSKGLEILVEAIGKCKEIDCTLNVYGTGPQMTKYVNYAEALGVGNKILWHGFVEQKTLWSLYKKVDVFVFPSLKEPTGGAMIEAMSMGLPVICIDYGGPADIVTEECAIKIPLGTRSQIVEALSNAIREFSENPSKRKTMGNMAWKRIKENYTWDIAVNKMINLYREIGISSPFLIRS